MKLRVLGISARLVDSDTHLASAEHEVLTSHLSVANDLLALQKVATEHGLCQNQVVFRVDALRQERVSEQFDEVALTSF